MMYTIYNVYMRYKMLKKIGNVRDDLKQYKAEMERCKQGNDKKEDYTYTIGRTRKRPEVQKKRLWPEPFKNHQVVGGNEPIHSILK